jgi:hypothetical protein
VKFAQNALENILVSFVSLHATIRGKRNVQKCVEIAKNARKKMVCLMQIFIVQDAMNYTFVHIARLSHSIHPKIANVRATVNCAANAQSCLECP